jgi:hypothetical protein
MIVKRIDDLVIILAISTMAIIMVISTYNTTFAIPPHCDKKGWPSCYSIGYQAALDDSKAGNADVKCSKHHSANFCNGYSDGWQSAHNNNNQAPNNPNPPNPNQSPAQTKNTNPTNPNQSPIPRQGNNQSIICIIINGKASGACSNANGQSQGINQPHS